MMVCLVLSRPTAKAFRPEASAPSAVPIALSPLVSPPRPPERNSTTELFKRVIRLVLSAPRPRPAGLMQTVAMPLAANFAAINDVRISLCWFAPNPTTATGHPPAGF